jgi:hypothetical protein
VKSACQDNSERLSEHSARIQCAHLADLWLFRESGPPGFRHRRTRADRARPGRSALGRTSYWRPDLLPVLRVGRLTRQPRQRQPERRSPPPASPRHQAPREPWATTEPESEPRPGRCDNHQPDREPRPAETEDRAQATCAPSERLPPTPANPAQSTAATPSRSATRSYCDLVDTPPTLTGQIMTHPQHTNPTPTQAQTPPEPEPEPTVCAAARRLARFTERRRGGGASGRRGRPRCSPRRRG